MYAEARKWGLPAVSSVGTDIVNEGERGAVTGDLVQGVTYGQY